ncbi:hypothetical protein K458DRAFT_432540 [Lentithecium fluviatile CBS 122367]|uniref:Secreted protein n=1 Tax=Lentithecium fluviatile CBS 122367 TaxID=1168545 RepID=A0A6G1IY71_9PLEO|nr:hypothetical protein K458DRAFT_432540 [Lentithecium fluviatile CBS 122367]
MRFFTLIAALVALVAATPVELEERQSKPDPNTVYVEKVSWAGTGCPPGSAQVDLAEEGTLVSLAFSKYVAATGTGQSASDARKNCDVRITLHYPQGWSYTVASTDLRGYARIPQGCSARLGATFFFSGQSNDAKAEVPFSGPIDNNYRLTVSVPTQSLVWSKCGVTGPLFNVNSQAIINCSGKDSILGVDTQDTKFTMYLHLQWKKC